MDFDDVCVTNTNRQLHAMRDTVGEAKVTVMAGRALRINLVQCHVYQVRRIETLPVLRLRCALSLFHFLDRQAVCGLGLVPPQIRRRL